MMIVITMSCCPSRLRGDLTRWLIEIDTGVYVGNLNARVRDAVWARVCKNIGNGRATMVYSANNEQKMEFCIHNASWEPVDYDGIKLVRRNFPPSQNDSKKQMPKAMVYHNQHKRTAIQNHEQCYAVIDLETTGVQDQDQIIEIGALLVNNGNIQESFSVLVICDKPIPEAVVQLTGITDEMLKQEGIPLRQALERLIGFVEQADLIGYHIGFDLGFLHRGCQSTGLEGFRNRQIDVQTVARKKLKRCRKFSLSAVAEHLEIEIGRVHRALDDCMLTYRIYEKLKEN